MTRLTEFAARYVSTRQVSPEYAANIKRRAAFLEGHAAESALEKLLCESVVNNFLASLDRRPSTVKSYRADILSLWNGAADLDLVPYPVLRRIYRVNVPAMLVDCYTVEETRKIVAIAESADGVYPNGVPLNKYWPAAIRLAWDSGIRRGDCWRYRREYVRPDGTLRIIQRKTGRLHTARLRPKTLAALDAIGLPQPCRWMLDPTYFGRHFRRLVKASGINRGTFKWFRRASGSYVEAEQSGAGAKHLGHADPRVFDRHYDAKLGGHTLPMPPEL